MSHKVVVFAGLCIAINIVLVLAVKLLALPLVFLDALGTILCAVVYGFLRGIFAACRRESCGLNYLLLAGSGNYPANGHSQRSSR